MRVRVSALYGTLAENLAGGTIGTLSVVDPDAGDTHSWSVDDARFEVSGGVLKLKAGIGWTEVHYRGNAPAINDLVAGHVDIGFQQLVDSSEHLKAGKLRALAVLSQKRSPLCAKRTLRQR